MYVVGVPVTLPLVVLNTNPLGKLGLTLYVKLPYPPLAVTGVNIDTA